MLLLLRSQTIGFRWDRYLPRVELSVMVILITHECAKGTHLTEEDTGKGGTAVTKVMQPDQPPEMAPLCSLRARLVYVLVRHRRQQ